MTAVPTRIRAIRYAVAFLAGGLSALPLCAQAPDLLPFLRAASVSAAPVIDGNADDGVWRQAIAAGPFVSLDGSRLADEKTTLLVAADTQALYALFTCAESLLNPVLQRTHEVKAEVTAADGPVADEDCVELFLQPGGEGAPYYHLAVNPRGTLYDARCAAGATEVGWSSQARVAVSMGTSAWVVEMAVPLRALGGAPAAEATWRCNAARRRSSGNDGSVWSPTGTARHTPARFGTLAFAAPELAVAAVEPPGFEEGPQRWQFAVRSSQALTATVLTRYGSFPWDAHSEAVPASDTAVDRRLGLVLSRRNTAIHLNAPADKAADTLCFRTERLPVRGGLAYRFAARVRADGLTGGSRPLAFSISSYGADDQAIRTYQPVLPVPEGTYDWRDVQAEWQAPANAASILFWMVKWGGSGVSGRVWVDDLRLLLPEGPVNVLPNGGVELDAEGAVWGWKLFSGTSAQPSYERANRVVTALELCGPQGALLLRSGPFAGEVVPRVTAISAALMLTASMGDSDHVLRLRELSVNEGGVLALPLVLRSSHPDRYPWVDVRLAVPEVVHLLPPEPRAEIAERRLADGRRLYRIRFGPEALSPMDGKKADLRVLHLLAECGVAAEAPATPLSIRLGGQVEGAAEELAEIPLHVLPVLRWARPAQVPITNWACSTFYRPFRQMNDCEQDAIARHWRQAGFTSVGAGLDPGLRERYGFSARGHVPLITGGSNFPQGREYLAAHPEARAVAFDGTARDGIFCPTYFLSEANEHMPQVVAWLSAEARKYPHVDWDYEVPVLRDSSICTCDRCLSAFRQATAVADPAAVTRESVRQSFRRPWVDWRCRENARLAEAFRRMIKAANPDCLFSIYSGYQGDTDEKYGVDWRSMAVPADLVWAGYSRPLPAVQATHAAIAGRPFICGLLAWYGAHPWDNGGAQVDLWRRLSDGGSGIMTYFNWIVDGRFYQAVSRVAALTADFEGFFRWDVAADGTYRSRYQRGDDLVEVAGEGKPEDVTVLRHGEDRLLFVFNPTSEARRVALFHRQWRGGMACVEAETGELFAASHELVVPARDVRLLHVRPPGPPTVAAPRVLSDREGVPARDVVLAWQGQGSQPGDQVFELQLSPTPDFAPATLVTHSPLPATAFAARTLAPGQSAWWRVRGLDAVSKLAGPWSEPVRATRGAFAEFPSCPAVFSPDGDGMLEVASIAAELAVEGAWWVRILGPDGRECRRFEGRGRQVEATWDGRNAAAQALAAGTYRYEVVPAGQQTLALGGTVEINPRVGRRNPGLERCQGFVLTVPTGQARIARDYAVTATDSYAMALSCQAPGSDAYWSNYSAGGLGTPPLPVVPGKAYRFAARLRTDLSQGEASLALTFFTADGRWAGVPGREASGVPSEAVTGKSDWSGREVVLTAPPGAASAVLFFRAKGARGTAWFDAVEFAEVPAAPGP